MIKTSAVRRDIDAMFKMTTQYSFKQGFINNFKIQTQQS